jgi:hypothetical protein
MCHNERDRREREREREGGGERGREGGRGRESERESERERERLKIWAYNRRVGEIIREQEQVTLMELDTERKNHTRHGLHFNKLGKWWLSHKITKSIYSILGVKTEQSRKMESKQRSQENKNKV